MAKSKLDIIWPKFGQNSLHAKTHVWTRQGIKSKFKNDAGIKIDLDFAMIII